MDKEIKLIEKKVSPIVTEATSLKISDDKSMGVAVTLLSNCNKQLDKITEEKEKITKPLNEALKAERARWKPIETVLTEAVSVVRKKMSAYQTELLAKQREEQEKIAKRVEKGTLKVETGIKKMSEVKNVDKEIATNEGLVQFREVQTLKITDEKKIPREYLVIDEKSVLEALKAGKNVPGAEVEIVQVPVNFR